MDLVNCLKFKKGRRYLWYVLLFFCILFYGFLPRELFNDPYSTVVLSRDGEVLGARIASDGQWRFPLDAEIPEKLKTCIIYFEDEYFHYHWGVNPISIGKAFVSNIKAKRVVRGGSTITMQTVRLARREARTIWEKMIEAVWAVRLEFRYSKSEILNLYASHAPFGGNVVGYTAAAWRYFGHTAGSLSWAEAATLAVLPNAPSAIHISRQRGVLKKKRDGLLQKLYENEIITADELELALLESLPDEPLPLPQIAPHLVTRIAQEYPGQQIRTTIDRGLQMHAEQILNSRNKEFAQHNIRDIAATILDVNTGEVLVYYGNSDFGRGRDGSQVDIINARRSSGSILKPFLMAAMLEEGQLLTTQIIPDVPINIGGFSPQNFSLTYEGAVPASQVISRSLNIPSVYMLKDYAVPKFYDKLQALGLTTLNYPSGHYGLSLILGGAEMKLGEVAAAYMRLAQEAQGLIPYQMNYLLDKEPIALKKVFSAGASWQTLDVLKEVNRPGEVDWKMMRSMQNIAWKTGTSHGFRDGWSVGTTSKYTVGVWMGNATGEGNAELVGGRTAGPVMFDLFNILPQSRWFERPKADLIEAEICRESGYLKSRFCEHIDTVLILPQGLNTDACKFHHLVHLTPDEKYRVYTECVGNELTIEKSWFTLPPVWEWYYKSHHSEYKVLPPYKPGCGEDSRLPMQFIYPHPNADLILTKQMDGKWGEITLDLAHSNSNVTVFWHLDGSYLGETNYIHKLTIAPSDGEHNLTVVDNLGNTYSIHFSVRRLSKSS